MFTLDEYFKVIMIAKEFQERTNKSEKESKNGLQELGIRIELEDIKESYNILNLDYKVLYEKLKKTEDELIKCYETIKEKSNIEVSLRKEVEELIKMVEDLKSNNKKECLAVVIQKTDEHEKHPYELQDFETYDLIDYFKTYESAVKYCEDNGLRLIGEELIYDICYAGDEHTCPWNIVDSKTREMKFNNFDTIFEAIEYCESHNLTWRLEDCSI